MHDVRTADVADPRRIGRGFLEIDSIIAAQHRVDFDRVILFEIAKPDFATAAVQGVQRLRQAMAATGQPTEEQIL